MAVEEEDLDMKTESDDGIIEDGDVFNLSEQIRNQSLNQNSSSSVPNRISASLSFPA